MQGGVRGEAERVHTVHTTLHTVQVVWMAEHRERRGRCGKAHRRADADGGGADLDSLDGVLDLEEATLRREGVHAAVVLAPSEEHLRGPGQPAQDGHGRSV